MTLSISFLRHNCGTCPPYWFWRYGKSGYGGLHYFTLFGFRVVIKTYIKKETLRGIVQ